MLSENITILQNNSDTNLYIAHSNKELNISDKMIYVQHFIYLHL